MYIYIFFVRDRLQSNLRREWGVGVLEGFIYILQKD